jgi:hypothetical protein
LLVAAAAMTTAQPGATLTAQTANPSTQKRLEFTDLSYVGGFRLPAAPANGDSFSIGGKQLTYNPANNSLFVGSRAGRIAEVSIPSPVQTTNPEAMTHATYLQGFFDPTEGRLGEVASGGVNLDSLLVYNNRLYGTASIFYDAVNAQRVSHYSRSLDLDEPSFSGWSSVWQAEKTGFVSGSMSVIPTEWRDALGGPAATGQCCLPIVGRTSWGPSAFAFNPSHIAGAAAAPAMPLLYYTGEHPTLGIWNASSEVYGSTTFMGGMAIIAGTRTALYFGRNGLGENCYGTGTSDQSLHGLTLSTGEHFCYDPTSTDKGPHAYPYRYQIWAYDLNDFAAVKAGSKQPWDVTPYGVWPLELPTLEPTMRLGGVGYDAANQLLYLSQLFADKDNREYRPVIHVLHLNAAPTSLSGGGTPSGDTQNPPPGGGTSTVVSAISLAVDRSSPQVAGTAVTFSVSAVGGTVAHEYKWLVDAGSGFVPVTGWSAADAFTWTPATPNAQYRVAAWARSTGSTRDEPEAAVSTPFTIIAPPPEAVQSVTLAANKVAPQIAGTPITFTAIAQGGSNPVQYKWLLYNGSPTLAPLTGWTTNNTFTWTPAAANSFYAVRVLARANGFTTDEAQAEAQMPFAIAAPPPLSKVTLTTNKPAPQAPGTTIIATATVTGGATPHTFKWLIHDGISWKQVTDWTTSNTYAWTPTKVNPGHFIGVWVRSAGNTNDVAEKTMSLAFPIK